MSQVVYKYDITEGVLTALPIGAKPLSAALQGRRLQLWALVDSDAAEQEEYEVRWIVVVGTGQFLPLDDDSEAVFIDTFLVEDGNFVFHVFEIVKKQAA